ncbi:MAG TPA: PRC-barrel domain-containing protein [Anaerolineales bacterium]
MVAQRSDTASPIWQLFGFIVEDTKGVKVGHVDMVWADSAPGSLKFIGLRRNRFWGRTYVIPAADAAIDVRTRSIRVGYRAAQIRGAPRNNSNVSMTGEQEQKVYVHYGKA